MTKSKIVSLRTRKQKNSKAARRGYLPLEERIRELEESIDELMDFSLQQAERLNSQSSLLRRLIQLLRRQVASSSDLVGPKD